MSETEDTEFFVACRHCGWSGDWDGATHYDDGDGRTDSCCPQCGRWWADFEDGRETYLKREAGP